MSMFKDLNTEILAI